MGLDNIPMNYPCEKEGTAIYGPEREDGTKPIDCVKTIEAHACPWKRDLGDEPGTVQGIFGTFCWYRGKQTNYMFETLGEDPPFGGFYGPDSEGLNPEQCNALAAWMEDRAENYSHKLALQIQREFINEDVGGESYHRDGVQQYRYAAKWLRWVAEHADGANAWW
jgi:hypothetical protein